MGNAKDEDPIREMLRHDIVIDVSTNVQGFAIATCCVFLAHVAGSASCDQRSVPVVRAVVAVVNSGNALIHTEREGVSASGEIATALGLAREAE